MNGGLSFLWIIKEHINGCYCSFIHNLIFFTEVCLELQDYILGLFLVLGILLLIPFIFVVEIVKMVIEAVFLPLLI